MQLQPNAPALNRRLTGQRVVLLSVCRQAQTDCNYTAAP